MTDTPSWRVRLPIYQSESPKAFTRPSEAELDQWMESAEHGAEFGDVVVMRLLAEIAARPDASDAEASNARFLRWRDIREGDECTTCGGSGRRLYSNTSTWRRGAGGAAMTSDVCDECWGSGDAFHPGADLRALDQKYHQREVRGSVEVLTRAVGAPMSSCYLAIDHIVLTLRKLADKRGAPAAPYLPELARSLADVLDEAIGRKPRRERT